MWDKDPNAKVTMGEFAEYYKDISSAIGDDDYFM